MSAIKDEIMRQQEAGRTFRKISAAEQSERDDRAGLTGILSGCYDAIRSVRRSVELDQEVVITMRAVRGHGDVWFDATFEPCGAIFHGAKVETYATPALDTLAGSFDEAIRQFDGQIAYAALAAEVAPDVLA